MFGEKQAKELCHRVLSRCQDGAAEVLFSFSDSALTRFANNMIHQNVAERDAELMVRFFIGKQMGTATTNRLDESGLDEVVRRARVNAQASPADPDYPGLPEPATYTEVQPFDEITAEYTPEMRAHQVGVICRLAAEKGLNASGAFSTGAGELAIANSQGVFAHQVFTKADFQTVIMSEDSSGRAHGSAWKVNEINAEMLGRRAIETAERGRNPRMIEPGEYPVVLEHYVTEDILTMLNFYGMGAQSLLEGRSWMNDRLGQKVMDAKVTIWDDGLDPQGMPMAFDFEGVPRQCVEIVKEGVIIGPVYDRYTGAKTGKPSTGHALPPNLRGMGPVATNLFMATGDTNVAEMIRSTKRGLYINRFWYTRLVHPRDCVITGMTRDGVFMIENGELAYPVKNLRFTQSYVQALGEVQGIGREAYLLASEFGGLSVRVPPLKLARFNFTGSTV